MAWTPTLDQTGDFPVRLNASSSAGVTSQTVSIRVVSRAPRIDAVLNAASRSASQVCIAGSLAVVQGSALTAPSDGPPPASGKTQLTVNGVSVDIIEASETELMFRCPANASPAAPRVQVTTSFGVSNSFSLRVLSAAPGIFTLDGSGTGQGLVFLSGTTDVAALADPRFASQPVVPGDTLSLVVTGVPDISAGFWGTVSPRVAIGQFSIEVSSMTGVDGYPGVKILTVRLPRHVPIGDSIPIQVIAEPQGIQSNTVTIAIAPAE